MQLSRASRIFLPYPILQLRNNFLGEVAGFIPYLSDVVSSADAGPRTENSKL
jgi:hypothetical protein